MTLQELEPYLVVWTIRFSMLMLIVSLGIRLSLPKATVDPDDNQLENGSGGNSSWRAELAQHTWLLGSLFALLHTIVTICLVFAGSHSAAFEHTAATTEQYLGVRVGFGIYANHAFVTLWLFDALWWTGNPASYGSRSPWWNRLIIGFLIFIAVNGTIVFATGPIRWISVVAFAALGIAWWKTTPSGVLEPAA